MVARHPKYHMSSRPLTSIHAASGTRSAISTLARHRLCCQNPGYNEKQIVICDTADVGLSAVRSREARAAMRGEEREDGGPVRPATPRTLRDSIGDGYPGVSPIHGLE